jgi:adenine deaminase
MMNVPGVLFNDESVLEKIAIARMYGKKIDGHAPGLRGEALQAYIHAGPSTDHESFSESEAMEKIALGMKIQIREGSAARNFDALSRLMRQYPEQCMLCSDDLHPNDLIQGHINALVKKAIQKGIDKMKVLWCASVTPTLHYGLEVGLLRENDPADFLVIDDFERLTILKTYINGKLVAENGESLIPSVPVQVANNFKTNPKNEADFYIFHQGETVEANVIEANDGQLVTNRVCENLKVVNGFVMPDVERDILKIAVINRYQDGPIALGFIKNFGLTRGAIASSVAHDSHNIIAIGATDKAICDAANLIIEHRGGLSVVDGEAREVLPLPIAGIMTDLDGFEAARGYERLDRLAKKLGSTLRAPFMTLSFMALIVIPRLKLSDKGLFDCDQFQYVSLFDCK